MRRKKIDPITKAFVLRILKNMQDAAPKTNVFLNVFNTGIVVNLNKLQQKIIENGVKMIKKA